MGRAGGGQLRRLCVCSRKTPRREARAGSGPSRGSGARRTGRGGGGQRRPRGARDAGSRPAPLPLVVLRVKVMVSTTPRPQHVSVPRRGTRQEPGGSGGHSGACWGPQLRGVRGAPLQLSGSALRTPTSSLGRSRPPARGKGHGVVPGALTGRAVEDPGLRGGACAVSTDTETLEVDEKQDPKARPRWPG